MLYLLGQSQNVHRQRLVACQKILPEITAISVQYAYLIYLDGPLPNKHCQRVYDLLDATPTTQDPEGIDYVINHYKVDLFYNEERELNFNLKVIEPENSNVEIILPIRYLSMLSINNLVAPYLAKHLHFI